MGLKWMENTSSQSTLSLDLHLKQTWVTSLHNWLGRGTKAAHKRQKQRLHSSLLQSLMMKDLIKETLMRAASYREAAESLLM